MDEKKKYEAVSIPRREQPSVKESHMPARIQLVQVDLSTDVPFAEIEYVPIVSKASSLSFAQTIGPKTIDPIRETFFAMRSLATGIPFARNDPKLFYRQAKFMEKFTDDYPNSAPFFMYYPCYQHMGYEQLRTYFTWRTGIRNGDYRPISLTYIFLYLYELLNGIGVRDAEDGLDKLLAIWNVYREQENALDNYLPGWLKDYHVYYPLGHSFADFIREHEVQQYYLDLLLFDADADDSFALWSGMSSYDIAKSRFYGEGNDALFKAGFSAVLTGLRSLCAEHGCDVWDLLIDDTREGILWQPFGQALFYPWLQQPDHQVLLPGRETYTCADNHWTVSKPAYHIDRREIVGYLMKKTEVCLRGAVKYRYKLSANPDSFCNLAYRLGRWKITVAELDAVIEKSVAEFHRNLHRTVVVVDRANLDRIREEALTTQDKLIVPEEPAPSLIAQPQQQGAPPVPIAEPSSPAFDGWSALRAALSATELRALAILLRGDEDIKAFADENGLMLEVLADAINEKAMDTISDNLMDCEDLPILYDDYTDKIAEMVG